MYNPTEAVSYSNYFVTISIVRGKLELALSKNGAVLESELIVNFHTIYVDSLSESLERIMDIVGEEVYGVLFSVDEIPNHPLLELLHKWVFSRNSYIAIKIKLVKDFGELIWLNIFPFIESLQIDCCGKKLTKQILLLGAKIGKIYVYHISSDFIRLDCQVVTLDLVGSVEVLDMSNVQFWEINRNSVNVKEIVNSDSVFGIKAINPIGLNCDLIKSCSHIEFLLIDTAWKPVYFDSTCFMNLGKLKTLYLQQSPMLLAPILEYAVNLEVIDIIGKYPVFELEKIVHLKHLKKYFLSVDCNAKDRNYINSLIAIQRPDLRINENRFGPSLPPLRPI
jgi:hypothetical protein